MNGTRWVQRAAFAGAAGLAAWALVPGVGANAASSPPQTFSATSAASGVEYTFDRKPGLSQVGNFIHGASPYTGSTLAGAGVSYAQADSVYGGGVQGLPGLLCAAGFPCAAFDAVPGGFPPAYPFEAYAQYPSQSTSDATLSANKPIGGGTAPLTVYSGRTHAEAHELSALANATTSSNTFAAGVISTGSSTSTTSQTINSAGAVVSTAESLTSNINIVKLVHIDSIHSITTVTYDGTHAPKIVASTTVSGASVLGLAATIDATGVHMAGTTNKQILTILNQQLNYLLNANATKVTLVGGTNSVDGHAVRSRIGGVLVEYDNTVSGLPKAPPAREIPFCAQILASKLIEPLNPILSQIPANLCAPPQPPDPNARYFGTASIGSVGTLVSAENFDLGSDVPLDLLPGTLPGSGPTTTFVPGAPGTPGTSGTPGTAGTPGTSGQGLNPNPQVAGPNAVGYVENLGDAAKRLKYLFPALLLAVIGVLAGRVGKAPARLPRAMS